MSTFSLRAVSSHPGRGPVAAPSGSRRMLRRCSLALAALCWLQLIPATAEDPFPEPIVRIEEDWEVRIGVPDPDSHGPQIITVFSPFTSLSASHVVFELNHASLPDYDAGGMQLQRWWGDYAADWRNFPNQSMLAAADETIRYTMSVKVENGYMEYEVRNGTSTTWGAFGGQGYLKTSRPSSMFDLSTTYSPETSVANSRIGFAGHRVARLSRKAVRYYSAAGLVATDDTERVVHTYTEGD